MQLLNVLASKFPLINLIYNYYRGRKGGTRRENILLGISDDVQSGVTHTEIWDFSVKPYALGDILSWLIEVVVRCEKAGKNKIDLVILADPNRPSPVNQPYVVKQNFIRHLYSMLPAFSFCPMLNNIHIVQDRNDVESYLSHALKNNLLVKPDLIHYFNELNDAKPFRGFFSEMNQYYAETGRTPRFNKNSAYSVINDYLQFGFKSDAFFVCLHMRKRSANQESVSSGSNVLRDADPDIWIEFIKRVAKSHPNVCFVVLGRPDEISRQLYKLSNVLFLKHYGAGLAEEITAILEADLFMAISSGPAVAAIFSETPYLIYIEEINQINAAEHKEVQIGEQVQFAAENQIHRWINVNTEILHEDFSAMYDKLSQ